MKKILKIIGILVVSILVLSCGALCYHTTIGPELSFRRCYANFAKRAGIKNNNMSVINYVEEHIKPGMTEDEVYSSLEKMGGFKPGSLPHTPKVVLVNCEGFFYDYNLYLNFNDGVLDSYSRWLQWIDW
jgi:hypothetical protein